MRRTGVAVATALAAGFALGLLYGRRRLSLPADAAALEPHAIDVCALDDAALGPPRPGTDVHSRFYVRAPGATLAVQTGNVAKHYHRACDEVQYVVEGSGRVWFGDAMREVKPGDLLIIPRGLPHAGSIPSSGRFKFISIKTPPQQPEDQHYLT